MGGSPSEAARGRRDAGATAGWPVAKDMETALTRRPSDGDRTKTDWRSSCVPGAVLASLATASLSQSEEPPVCCSGRPGEPSAGAVKDSPKGSRRSGAEDMRA